DAARREAARVRSEAARAADRQDVVGPVHLPPNEREVGRHLSPDGRWMLVELAARNEADAPRDDMPIWVTEDGYVTRRPLRPKVGTRARRAERLVLIDLEDGESFDVDLGGLPERRVDRLAQIRRENRAQTDPTPASASTGTDRESAGDIIARLATETSQRAAGSEFPPEESPLREVSVMQIAWHPQGLLAAAMIRSLDNKDRWIVALDPRSVAADARVESEEAASLEDEGTHPTESIAVVEHLHDPAWINWSFNEMDWLRDGSELWYLSEGAGWSDLLAWRPGADTRPLVQGPFEIRDVVEHPTDGTLLYRTNRGDPSVWRLERLDPATGTAEGLAGGSGMVERFRMAPDGRTVALLESTLSRPAELFVVDLPAFGVAARPPRRLTDSASEAFRGLDWTPATLVDVPGRHGRDIRGRLHLPPAGAPRAPDGRRPAVLVVHGAGYLQNAHAGWSRYFREGFFHDLLARDGFVVLDLDYRASSGYGREWRTAIARNMGSAELDDYEDGIAWLTQKHDVDPERVGIYGGSYGGFTTLMGLFTRPGVFQAGAALRPVTDWTFYNDGYTANILNTPQDDPLAYRRSSPIEHADGLEDALLICHGMVDSNVPFSDSVRLAQRLIELGKADWELASYPVEGHGFRRDASWIDEYRRIRELFDETLRTTAVEARPAEPEGP
ncbi:MAG: prolyl oligopeptidase family serine peptidase, partial [Planctomycetota bacterium]|nr:prolyl oligopeptidase family serine peptidase [Planctomycetota bacterium]